MCLHGVIDTDGVMFFQPCQLSCRPSENPQPLVVAQVVWWPQVMVFDLGTPI